MTPVLADLSLATVTIAPSAVAIWCFDLDAVDDATSAAFGEMLCADERLRARTYRAADDRRHFMVCRGALRLALANRLLVAPSRIAFAYGPWGKPELAPPLDRSGLRFNVTHSGRYAAIALVAERAIGIDLEPAGRELAAAEIDGMSARFFSSAERRMLAETPGSARADAFTRIWTRREAVLKADGRGLAWSEIAGPEAYERLYERFGVDDSWAPPGTIAAVAVEGPAGTRR